MINHGTGARKSNWCIMRWDRHTPVINSSPARTMNHNVENPIKHQLLFTTMGLKGEIYGCRSSHVSSPPDFFRIQGDESSMNVGMAEMPYSAI